MGESTWQVGRGDPRPDARRIRGVVEVSELITERIHRAFPEPLWARGEILNCVFDEHGGAHFDLVEPPEVNGAAGASGRAVQAGDAGPRDAGPRDTEPRDAGRGRPDREAAGVDAASSSAGPAGGPSGGHAPAELHVHLTREAFARVRAALAPYGVDPRDLLFDGQAVLVSGQLTYAGGRVGLRMDGLDHQATTGMLTAAKRKARARLHAAGLFTRQRRMPTPIAPIRVAVIGGAHDTGLRDALHTMTTSELSIQARSITVGLEGRGALDALAQAVTQAASSDVDLVLVVRGDGVGASRAPFDAEAVAAAVASAPTPVITGIQGAEPTLVDEVAHLACGSPVKAAAEVVQRLRNSLRRLHAAERDAQEQARAALDRIEAAYAAAVSAFDTVAEAAEARSRRRLRLRRAQRLLLAGAALAVLLALVAAATTLQRLALAAAAAVGVILILRRLATRGDAHMQPRAGQPRTFEETLNRLEEIRGELTVTSAPETVVALIQEAAELRRSCESMLGWAEQQLSSPLAASTPPAALPPALTQPASKPTTEPTSEPT